MKAQTLFTISDFYLSGEKIILDHKAKKQPYGVSEEKTVYITPKLLKTENSIIAQYTYHELEHRNQYEKVVTNELSNSSVSFITTELIRKYENKEDLFRQIQTYIKEKLFLKKEISSSTNYYLENYFLAIDHRYKLHEIEKEADYAGASKAAELIKRYTPIMRKSINEHQESAKRIKYVENLEAKVIQKDSEKIPIEIFNIEMINSIIKKHPRELKKYPQLKNFFDSKGNKLSIKKLLCNCYDARKKENEPKMNPQKNPFFRFIKVDIIKNELDNIDLKTYTNEEQMKMFDTLSKVVYLEMIRIDELISVKRYKEKDEYKDAIQNSIEVIKKITKTLNRLRESSNYKKEYAEKLIKIINVSKEYLLENNIARKPRT